MAKNDNVQDLLRDIAEAIREKTGSTSLINPQDFSSKILSIQSGGLSDDEIMFSVYGQGIYYATSGTSWQTWSSSEYNRDSWTVNSSGVTYVSGGATYVLFGFIVSSGTATRVTKTDIIDVKQYYFVKQ